MCLQQSAMPFNIASSILSGHASSRPSRNAMSTTASESFDCPLLACLGEHCHRHRGVDMLWQRCLCWLELLTACRAWPGLVALSPANTCLHPRSNVALLLLAPSRCTLVTSRCHTHSLLVLSCCALCWWPTLRTADGPLAPRPGIPFGVRCWCGQ